MTKFKKLKPEEVFRPSMEEPTYRCPDCLDREFILRQGTYADTPYLKGRPKRDQEPALFGTRCVQCLERERAEKAATRPRRRSDLDL